MRKSFTLIEVLTVIAIIGILASLGAYTYAATLTRSRDSQRIADLQFIRNSLEQFYLDNRSFPAYQDYIGLPHASWQLEAGYGCQDEDKLFLAPKYLAKLPDDPSNKFSLFEDNSCSAETFGRYLYFGIPKTTSKTGYYLMARLERTQSMNYDSSLVNLDEYSNNNLPLFCSAAQFPNNPACSQNYFVTSSKNN